MKATNIKRKVFSEELPYRKQYKNLDTACVGQLKAYG